MGWFADNMFLCVEIYTPRIVPYIGSIATHNPCFIRTNLQHGFHQLENRILSCNSKDV
jgi:hypothetical protein